MRLQKENIQRVVVSSERANQMLNDGWCEVVEVQSNQVDQYDKLKKEALVTILHEKGIDFDEKAKKEELLKLLEGE